VSMEFQLVLYPFKWEFFLTKMDDSEVFNILIDDLISPMARAIKSLELRGDAYYRLATNLERDL